MRNKTVKEIKRGIREILNGVKTKNIHKHPEIIQKLEAYGNNLRSSRLFDIYQLNTEQKEMLGFKNLYFIPNTIFYMLEKRTLLKGTDGRKISKQKATKIKEGKTYVPYALFL